jgi:ribosomal protein S6E (S10)
MKLNIAYPANGSQKLVDIEDDRKLRPFMEKRMGAEVSRQSICRPGWHCTPVLGESCRWSQADQLDVFSAEL